MTSGRPGLDQSSDKIIPAQVILEDAACPLECPPDDEIIVVGRDRLHDLPGEFAAVRCRTCGLMRTNPRPTADTIGFYYPDDYEPYLTTRIGGEFAASGQTNRGGVWRGRLRKLLRYDERALPPMRPGRMLEIGCASGSFLAQMRQAGWEVEGLEASSVAAQAALKAGYTVQNSTVEAAKDPEEPYNLIVGWMVLEHLHEPVQSLSKLKRWCERHGWLVLSVPDSGSLEFTLFRDRWYALHLPCHLYHFSDKSLRKVLKFAGWKVERVYWHKNPNNTLNSLRYLALDHKWERLAKCLHDVTEGRRQRYMTKAIGVLLGLTRQSGRMTVWARPR